MGNLKNLFKVGRRATRLGSGRRAFIAVAVFVALFSALVALPAQNVLDPSWSDVASDVRPVIDASMKDANVTGMSIVLVDGDRVVWSEGFGYSDLAATKKVDADTMFEIGSVSKTFTGLMVMQLAEQGKIDIDRPVTDYIPEFKMGPPARDFPRNDRPITVRDLMAHHAGIPGDLLDGAFATAQEPDFNARLLAWLAEDSATYPPGYRWSYSNTAVALLQNVIEAASDEDFVSYSQKFLDSLGMAPASYFKTDPALLARLSKPYDEGKELPMTYINVPASGSIVASTNEMGRYLRMLIGRGSIDGTRIVRPETLSAMLTKQYPGNPLDIGIDQGLSFILSDASFAWAGPLFWHNGATLAFHSHLEVLPNQKLGVFVVGNSTSATAVVEQVAKAALSSALKLKLGMMPPAEPQPAALTRVALPEGMLKNIAGVYVSDDRGCYDVFAPADGGLAWHTGLADASGTLKDQGTLSLWSDGMFRTAADAPLAYEFKEAGGSFIFIVHKGQAQAIFGERYAPKPISDVWRAREGSWTGLNADPNDIGVVMGELPMLNLSESDGMLILKDSEKVLVLEPMSDTLAAVRGLGRFGGTAVRVVTGADGKETLRFMLVTYGKKGADQPSLHALPPEVNNGLTSDQNSNIVKGKALTADQIAAIGKVATQAAIQSLEGTGAASVTVAVGDDRGAFWQGQFGLADKQTQAAPTPDTMFGIGSTSKTIAAAATMILVDRGLVSLDEPLVKYLPQFKMASPGYEKITVRMLLDHSAGLPGSDYRGSMLRDPSVNHAYPEQVLETLARARLAHAPGYLSTYTNDGFTLLELLIKACTGVSYRDFVHQEIFKPLGMDHSAFLDMPLPKGGFARNYRGNIALAQEYLPLDATGSVCSTAQDMARFAAMLLGKGSFNGVRILSPEAVAAMGEDRSATKFNPLGSAPHYFRYGLGWDTISQEGMAIAGQRGWEKGGDTSSYGCSLIVLPDADLAAVVIGSSGINSSVASSIAERTLWKALAESGRIDSTPHSIIPTEVRTVPVPADLRVAALGVYVSYLGAYRLSVDVEDKFNLETLVGGEWKPMISGLRYADDGWFTNTSGERIGSGIKYVVGDGRAYLAIRAYESNGLYFNTQVFAQKLSSTGPMPDAWKKRVGSVWLPINYSPFEEYTSPTSDPRFTLTTVDGAEGYIFSTNPDGTATTLPVDANRSNSFILIPQLMGRDLYDLEILPNSGYELLRTTSTLFRPLESVPTLPPNGALITIGQEGWTEWIKVPASSRLSVMGGAAWALYGADFAQVASARPNGALSNAPEGWLAVYGAPGDQIRVTFEPVPHE